MSLFGRTAGVLCHVTSLPGAGGSGDLGETAFRFVDWLAQTGQGIWQVLPLGPPGFGDSPYQGLSAFAGNPLLVGLDRLVAEGWLTKKQLRNTSPFNATAVDFGAVRPYRVSLLAEAFERFNKKAPSEQRDEFEKFRTEQGHWLHHYALFAALKADSGGRAWTDWSPELIAREPDALEAASARLEAEIDREGFIQFQFDRQWRALKTYAAERKIQIMGDVPIFVSHDSVDVWTNQHLFELDAQGHSLLVAGVPPDYFSETGQLWGNPMYRWGVMAQDGFQWWVDRLKHALGQFDLVRLDHFRGFEAYWEIPGDAPTAASGRWVTGPGALFFQTLRDKLGKLKLIAEDLGLITPAVDALREQFELPGMRVLQFAFGDDPKSTEYQPHNYPRNCVVYTGTHDNDTAVGWFRSTPDDTTTRDPEMIAREQKRTLRYLGTTGREIHWDLIRLALASVADVAIIPMQDILGLGAEARMNVPGSASGNWTWRFGQKQVTKKVTNRLAELTHVYERGVRG